MKKLAVFTIASLVLGGIVAGCSDEEPAENNTTEPSSSVETGATPVVFANDKGEALCPVMGGTVANVETAKFQDHDGKRYYFCCEGCPETFAKQPDKYADGKAMPAEGTM
jgi:xanthine dehydrogenase accessory factor